MRLLIAVCVCLSCCVSSAWARADAPSDPMATLMVILRDHAHGAPRTDRRLRHRAQFQQRAAQTEAALPGRLPQPLRSAAQFEALPALNAWLIRLPQTALTPAYRAAGERDRTTVAATAACRDRDRYPRGACRPADPPRPPDSRARHRLNADAERRTALAGRAQ